MNLSRIFAEYAAKRPQYAEAVSIARNNSSGSLWLIGGYVFRALSNALYGTGEPACDFDFIAESVSREIILPTGWKMSAGRFGSPKLVGPHFDIDLVPLAGVHYIARRDLERTIGNFLDGTPLTNQSLAFDVNAEILLGEVGIEALLSRSAAIHNEDEARCCAERYGISTKEYARARTEGLGLTLQVRT